MASSLVLGALAPPLAAHAQALPDVIREAGVTVIQWQSVLAQVQRSAAEKHVSEKALGVVCAKMGVQLARGRHFELNQMISLISSRADEISALYQKLSLEEQQNSPAAGVLLKQTRAAIDAGDLDQAEAFLKQASRAARSAVASAQRQEAAITATDAQVKALQLDYLGAASTYAEAAAEAPANDTIERWAYVATQAAMLAKRGELFDEPQPLHEAVVLYRDTALALVPPQAYPQDWAATQNNLGNALETLGELGDDQALHDAVAAFHSALAVDTRDRDPSTWARDQTNLGGALRVLGERGDEQALHDAVAALSAALDVLTPDHEPAAWATGQNNLGIALRALGEHGDEQALHDAVEAFRAALAIQTRDRDPAGWAMDENNLGIALRTLGERGDEGALRDAPEAFRDALTVLTRDNNPADWAAAQNNLGNALLSLGERGDDAALHDAVAAHRAALQVWTRERDPADWAMAENNLGAALRALGERGDDQALRDAVSAFRAALEVWTPEGYPAYAKGAAGNLARAEAELAARGK